MKKVFSTILMAIGVTPLVVMILFGLIAGLVVNGFRIGFEQMDYKSLQAKMNKKE